jgi:penicillin-binding protein 1C
VKAGGPNASRHRRRRRWAIRLVGAAVLLGGAASAGLAVAWVTNPFPESRLERWDRTRTVTASDGTPLLQLVGRDEQWRTPLPLAAHSPLLAAATVAVEDRRFREHHGVDPWAVVRAAWQNLSSGRVVSGASTLSMQVCRMMDDRPRTLESKAIEAFRALQLERLRSKDQILEHYLNVAPYGGNVRGAAAAARRYFGKPADRLSLAEAALLAGLPQSPERLRPDRHPDAARTRRATVLAAMFDAGFITEDQRAAADAEPVRVLARGGGGDHAPPAALASHAAWMALVDRPAGGRTTIESPVQRMLEEAVAEHRRTLPPGTDIAVVVLDVDRSSIVGLVGSADPDDPADGQVNGVLARRSPGSALKPFIYAAAMDAGRLAADSPLPDAPIDRGGWRPENFDRRFRGTVSTAEALQASLNIPAILVTEELGLVRCLGVMEAAGLSLPADAASRRVRPPGPGRRAANAPAAGRCGRRGRRADDPRHRFQPRGRRRDHRHPRIPPAAAVRRRRGARARRRMVRVEDRHEFRPPRRGRRRAQRFPRHRRVGRAVRRRRRCGLHRPHLGRAAARATLQRSAVGRARAGRGSTRAAPRRPAVGREPGGGGGGLPRPRRRRRPRVPRPHRIAP